MSVVRALMVVSILVLAFSPASFATQASCAFTTFTAPAGYTLSEVDGIGDDGTVVGQLENNATFTMVGFMRAPDGTFKTYTAPKSRTTNLNGRNGSGASVGYYLDTASTPHVHGFILQGSQFTLVNYPNAANTWLMGINTLGSVTGAFRTSSLTKGFIRTNGTFKTIAYSGAETTFPQALNDNGVVVGSYSSSSVNHGFIWQNGKFSTVDYPRSKYGTVLVGINNVGVIVGNHISADRSFGFLYVNGGFKSIVYSGANFTMAGGINNNGVVSGEIDFTNGTVLGYTAKCQ